MDVIPNIADPGFSDVDGITSQGDGDIMGASEEGWIFQ